jgi:hypothetical protein
MAKPFVSLDGEDKQGIRAEVWVQTGTAKITEIKPARNYKDKDWDPVTSTEKPANVGVKVTSEILRDGISGWISTSDPLYPKLVEAYSLGTDVEYRIEWQRNKEVDRTTSVKELRGYNEQTGKSDMGLSGQNGRNIFAGIDGMLAREAVTDPEEDPDRGGRHSAVGQKRKAKDEAPSGGASLSLDATLTGLATARAAGLPEGVVDAAAALALAAGATAKQVAEAGVSEQAPAQRREAARAHAKEATPYTAYNTDGRLNLGNSAVSAAFGAERFAHGLLAASRQAAFEAHNAAVLDGTVEAEIMNAPEPVEFGQSVALARALLDLCDRVQVGAYGGGRPDRMSSSHTRARSLVYQIIETSRPVPFGAEPEVRTEWMEAVIAEAVAQFQALAAIAFPGQAPAPAQQQQEQTPAEQPTPAPQAPAEQPAPAPQAPAEQPAPAPQVGVAGARPKPPVEGEDDFVAPTPELMVRFGTLCNDAGFAPGPESEISTYLNAKFGVSLARQVHGPALDQLVTWFEQRDEDAARQFRTRVLGDIGQAPADEAASA